MSGTAVTVLALGTLFFMFFIAVGFILRDGSGLPGEADIERRDAEIAGLREMNELLSAENSRLKRQQQPKLKTWRER